jgi:serine/threonine protein kinase/Tol biopolymer transport system component
MKGNGLMDGDLLGQTLGERYHFEELLGEGSFARVYRITDLNRRATLAAKVLRHDIAQDETFLERFRREAAVLARLQHPNIVRYYDIVETDGTLFILMDYIPGSTLETELANAAEPLQPTDTLPILTPLASALHFAHYEGVIHRDLKPANILIHTNGTLLVTDFGIARILNATSELTMGISIGTPFYMAPEQITGGLITPATDIYALGIVLYRMVTGRVPFRGERPGTSGTSTSARITYEHVHLEPEPPRYLNPALDLAVQEVILRCLDKNPARRYQSAGLFYDAFTEAVGAPPISLGSPAQDQETPPPRPPEWSQLIAPVERQPTPPPLPANRTINRIEHPVPLPPTQPHLEDALRAAHQQRTIPSLGRIADSLPAPRRSSATPSHTASITPPRARRPNWALIAVLAGVLLVVGVALAAVGYLVLSAGENPEPTPAVTTPEIFTSPAPPIDRGGNQIAFDSQRSGSLDIYIMNVDGSNFRQLTGSSGAERGPAWSPDASQIAFYGAAAEDANYDIFVINTDGTGLRNLTNSPTIDDKYPTWSPDGTRLAFHSNADGDYDLYIINLDGSGLHAITNDDADDLGPDWSPEGTQIVFHTDVWGQPYEIALLDLNTLQVRRLTDNDDTNAFPTWSPDGTQIAYHAISSLNGVLNIFVMRMDTGAARQITTGQSSAFPDWSPDGTRIIYQSGEPNVSAIDVIPVEGGTPEALTGTQANFLPEWEPFKN